tara:strand:+ start:149 stop:634 length:486 start_codon:yes stop_codon:yes gene_type:complete
MPVSNLLKEIAKNSPKGFAKIILQRNEEALKELEAIHDEIKEPCLQSPAATVNMGCPHCNFDDNIGEYLCVRGEGEEDCLWTKMTGENDFGCCGVKFNGVSHNTFNDCDYGFSIAYDSTSVYISYSATNSPETFDRTYKQCRKFLLGHIAWAKLDCWGENL